jgi:hypothetical protein
MKRLILLLALLLCFVPLGFAGAVVYDNGAPNLQNGNEMTAWIQAEDFMLGTNTLITDVHFWTIEAPGALYAGSIWYGIYLDNGGQPNLGNPLVEGFLPGANLARVATGRVAQGFYDEYYYSFDIMPFMAQAGVTYWLGLHNGPIGNDVRAEIYWETTDPNGTIRGNEDFLPPAGDGWSNNGQEHAFQLTSIPEPSSLLLMGSGVLGLAGLLRRKMNF